MATWRSLEYPTGAARLGNVTGIGVGQPHQGLVSHTKGTDGDFQVASHTLAEFIWMAEA